MKGYLQNKVIDIDKLLLLLISIESMGAIMPNIAQTTPLIYLVALLGIKVYVPKIHFTKILSLLLIFFSYTLLLTLIYFVKEFGEQDFHIIFNRLHSFPRQMISFLLGIMLFLVFRSITLRLGIETVLRFCIYSIIPIGIFVFFESRYLFIDPDYRIKAYFSEPSHLADFIVQIFFASVFVYYKIDNRRISNARLVIFCLVALLVMVLTSSGTGFIKLIFFLVGIFLFEKNAALKLILLVSASIIFCIVGFYFLTVENNYLVNVVVASAQSSDTTVSFVDRYYSFIGPFSSIFKSLVSLGYGFGGDNIYYKDFYPQQFIEMVQLVKNQEFSIPSFWGKILVFSGLPGLLIWIIIIYNLIHTAKTNFILRGILPVLLSVYLTNFIGSGAFLFVQHWFWMALIDADNIKQKGL